MKKSIIILSLLSIILLGSLEIDTFETNEKTYNTKNNGFKIKQIGHKDSTTIIIKESGELLINNKEIKLDANSEFLTREYYFGLKEIRKKAIKIGIEGGKIGLNGTGLGLKAIMKLPLLLLGEDKYEEAIEKEAEKLEAKAEKLELKADSLESDINKLEIIEKELAKKIPELKKLIWFSK